METDTQSRELMIPPEAERHLAAARATRARLRTALGLKAFAKWLPWAVLFLTPLAISYRFEILSGPWLVAGIAGGALGLAIGVMRAVITGPGLLAATLRLDAAHDLRGRLAAALEYLGVFGRSVPSDGGGYVSVVLAEARELAPLSPKRAAALSLPSELGWGVSMLACWGALLFLPARTVSPPPLPTEPPVQEQEEDWLLEDDAELLEAAAQELEESVQSEDAKAAAQRFNEIVLRAVEGKIDQAEAFRLAAELQADLDAAGKEAAELAEGLEKRGASLEKRSVTRPLGRALQDRQYQDAEEAMKKLAERLSQGSEPLSEKELQELRDSIEEMRGEIEKQSTQGDQQAQTDEAERKALEERQKRLLKKKQEGKLSDQERQEMTRNERRLKRLSRRKKNKSAQKTLSELDKQLAEAARELMKEQKKAGQFMQQAARTLSEGTQKRLTDQEKQELIKQLKALKERLRRQNKDGKQAERLRKFLERARGQKGQQKPGQGQQGKGQSKSGQGQMRLGPNGQPIPMAGQGQRAGGAGKDGEGEGQGDPGGKQAGRGHNPNLEGDASKLEGSNTEDVNAVAQDTGQGESASETILSVAEEGFTSRSYEKLYREYETVAEEVMEKDAVPVGRKAHVLRYFKLIRPRGGQSSTTQGSTQGDK